MMDAVNVALDNAARMSFSSSSHDEYPERSFDGHSGASPIRAARMYAEADLALLEAAVAIAIPVQELHDPHNPFPTGNHFVPSETAEKVLPGRCEPCSKRNNGVTGKTFDNEESCGSAQGARQTAEQTDPFTEPEIFAEQKATVGSTQLVLSATGASLSQHGHTGRMPSLGPGDEAERGPAQHCCLSGAYEVPAGSEVQGRPASSALLPDEQDDQQVVTGVQEATAEPDHADSTCAEQQDPSSSSTPTLAEKGSPTPLEVELVLALSSRHSQSKLAVSGMSTHALPELDLDSSGIRQPSRLLTPLKLPRQEPLAGVAAIHETLVCESDAPGSGSPLDACPSLNLSQASSSRHSSPAASATQDVHGANMQLSECLTPREVPPVFPTLPGPVRQLEGSGACIQPAAQAHSTAVTQPPGGSGRAVSPALTNACNFIGTDEGAELIQRADSGPESSLSLDCMPHEAAEELEYQANITGGCPDYADVSRTDAQGSARPSMHDLPGLLHGSKQDQGQSASLGPSKQSGQASSTGSPHVESQSTSRADDGLQDRQPELVQEVLSSLQLSHNLTSASQELLTAMHIMHTPVATDEAGVKSSCTTAPGLAIDSLDAAHLVHLLSGLAAKYGGLEASSSDTQLQVGCGTSSGSDAALPKETIDSTPNAAEDVHNEDAMTGHSTLTPDAREVHAEPEEGALPGVPESPETGEHGAATGSMAEPQSTVSDTGDACNTSTSTKSRATASATDEPSDDEENKCNWAACLEACKGRLNRMLLDCGMPSLPCQEMGERGSAAEVLANLLCKVLQQLQHRRSLAEELVQELDLARLHETENESFHARALRECNAKQREVSTRLEAAMAHAQGCDKAAAEAAGEVRKQHKCVALLSKQLADTQLALRRETDALEEQRAAALQCREECTSIENKLHQVGAGLQAAELASMHLRANLQHAKRAARVQEAAAEKLRARLVAQVTAEERRCKRNAEAYTRARRTIAADRGNLKGRATAGAVSAALRELRPVEIVGLYEDVLESHQAELAVVKAELKTSLLQLRDREQAALAKGPIEGSAPGAAQMAALSRKAAEAQLQLTDARRDAAEVTRCMIRKLAEAERHAQATSEENANLALELNLRPSNKQLRSLQRQVQALQHQLARAKARCQEHSQTAPDPEDSPVGDTDMALTTRQRMRRDRRMHDLGLASMYALPHDVLVDTLQQLCLAAGISDVTALPGAMAKHLRASAVVPELEAFVDTVCEVVFRKGGAFCGGGQESAKAVPDILQAWIAELKAFQVLQAMHSELQAALEQRASIAPSDETGSGSMLAAVRGLVEAEHRSAALSDTLAAAERLARGDGQGLLQRIVSHFQHLFAVPSIEGGLTAINQVYVTSAEAAKCRRVLVEALGLDMRSSMGQCMQQVMLSIQSQKPI